MSNIIDFPSLSTKEEFPVLFFMNAHEYEELMKENAETGYQSDIEMLVPANENRE